MKFARIVILACLASLAHGAPAFAADARLRTFAWEPNRIITLHGHDQVQTMISFAEDERIENIAVGDSAGWQVTPNKRANRLFIKPILPGATTNMTIITSRRTYLFELSGRKSRATPVYAVNFTYPPEPIPAAITPPATMADATALTPPPPAAETPQPSALNFAWTGSGKKKLLPARIFDDGLSTYLKWDATADMPAIFVQLPGGQQGPVNQIVMDGYVVIDHVPAKLILQLGKDKALLVNSQPVEARSRPGDALAATAGEPQP